MPLPSSLKRKEMLRRLHILLLPRVLATLEYIQPILLLHYLRILVHRHRLSSVKQLRAQRLLLLLLALLPFTISHIIFTTIIHFPASLE